MGAYDTDMMLINWDFLTYLSSLTYQNKPQVIGSVFLSRFCLFRKKKPLSFHYHVSALKLP